MADIKKIEVYLPAHAHRALRIFAIQSGKSASQFSALDRLPWDVSRYKSLDVHFLPNEQGNFFLPPRCTRRVLGHC